ncbi:MAG: ABC transporter permease [Candidatus Bathyarchaeia archaeon]|jgi:peptide/nickel transport system permease protein
MSLTSRWEEFKTGMRPRISEWRFMLKRMRQSNLAMAGLIIILGFVVIACLAPVLAPIPSVNRGNPWAIPQDQTITGLVGYNVPTPPTTEHIFGTTYYQYDIYYGCIWGTITAFRVGLTVVVISLIVGLLIGTLAAFYGGVIDEALMRFTDIIIAFPGLILAIAIVLAFPVAIPLNLSMLFLGISAFFVVIFLGLRRDRTGAIFTSVFLVILAFSLITYLYFPLILNLNLGKLDKVLVALTLVGWPGYARLIRGEVLRVKNEDFVEASRASGSSDFRTITRHILPNSIYPVFIVATLDIGSVILTAAALAFIGIGAPPNYPDWGQLVSASQSVITNASNIVLYFHTFFIPGFFIAMFVVGWNLLGDALRDVLDPMLRRR